MHNNDWYRKTVQQVLHHLSSNITTGLTSEQIADRQKKYGENALPKAEHDSYIKIFLHQLNSPFLYILMVAAVIKYFLEGYRDAIIIVIIIIVNALIGTIQEGKAQNMLASLQDFIKTTCIALRNGKKVIINEYELVPGDIIILQEGARIPADARVIESSLLKINESILTGESEGVKKQPGVIEHKEVPLHDQSNMLFMGTHVISGNGVAVVVATGLNTEIGSLKKTLEKISTTMPLYRDIKRLARIIMSYSIGLSLLLFVSGVFLGKTIQTMLFTLTSLFVAVVPESIPVITTIVLAVGAYRMTRTNVLIKRLPAIDALGRINVLVVDKTGTLTRNEQVVCEVFADNKYYSITGRGYHTEGQVFHNGTAIQNPIKETALWRMGLIASLLDQSELNYDQERKSFMLKGEPMHAALGLFAKKIGFDREEVQKEYKQINEIPFTSESRRYIACYEHNGQVTMIASGSPEAIMEISRSNKETEQAFTKMLAEGLRIIAIAYKSYPTNQHKQEKESVKNLNFLGFIGMQDALREDLREIVQKIKEAGIQMVMATGDHKKTALYVAKEAGIFNQGDLLLEGEDFRKLSKSEIAQELVKTTVLARVTPQEKIDVVQGFHTQNKIVAMTGDGVNDAPALVAADVGIAMGRIGTEVAKEAADIVLLDDSLNSIVAGIAQGRHILNTLHRVVFYLFTTNMSEFLLIALSIFLQLPLPLLATQILWENLVTDGFLDIGLSLEPMQNQSLNDQPVESIFLTKKSFIKLIWMGSLMSFGALYIFVRYYQTNIELARTMTLITVAMFQWFNAWNLRSLDQSIFTMNPFSNKWLLGMTISIVALQVFAIYNSFFQQALHIAPLELHHWIEAFIIASTILIAEELRKFWVRSSKNRPIIQSKN